jgi:cell division septum initiation protein DivIVA
MTEYNDVVADGRDDPFDSERRGYSRRQVDEYIAWRNGQIRELESKLSQGLTEIERLRAELDEARAAGGRPAHEEVSERVGQILKLAADEAKAERDKGTAEMAAMRDVAKSETDKLRADVKDETDRLRAEAQDRAERMLTAAQEQSERAISSARSEADGLVSAAQQTAEQLVADATKHADSTVATAIAQAKQQLDDATARATAIHEGAERRLNLLISRHTETVRRLTEIRDVVTSLVAGEAARGSLEDEVTRALAAQTGTNGERQSSGPHDSPHAGAHRAAGASHRSAVGAGTGTASAIEGRRAGAAASTLDNLGETSVPRPPGTTRQQTAPIELPEHSVSPRHPAQSGDTSVLPDDDDQDDVRHGSDSLTH